MGKKLEKLQKNLENIQTTFGKQTWLHKTLIPRRRGKNDLLTINKTHGHATTLHQNMAYNISNITRFVVI